MGLAYTLWSAFDAIAKANRTLKANGMTAAKIPAAERDFVERLAFAEITVGLQEPARQLVTLLRNRSHQLAADQAELDATVDELVRTSNNKLWGAF